MRADSDFECFVLQYVFVDLVFIFRPSSWIGSTLAGLKKMEPVLQKNT